MTTDFFAFDTSTDYYMLRALDPDMRAVEMDDAPLASASTATAASPSSTPLTR